MNTTYTYIQTHKSLYENQVLSCGSSSRGADKPNTKYVAGRKGNRSNQPTCALLSRNCFKLVISHCLTAAPQLFRYCWWKGWGMSDLRNQNCLFTKQVQDGQKQSKIFPSASVLLSIKAGWPCPGKISRRFILSSQSSWLMYRANDDLGATPQEKIKFVVIFHFTSNASYQTSQLTLTTFSYYWLKRGGWKKWPRGKDLCIFDQLSSFPLTQ